MGSVQASALEGRGRVAAITLTPVLTEVNVVLLVTRQTGRVQLDLAGGLLVTAGAGEFCVRPVQRESGFLPVVEFPDAPAVRGVALRAFLTQIALVNVVAAVAVDAAAAYVPILARRMTLLARHRDVQAHEREIRKVVVEGHRRSPAVRRMTARAVDAELAGVHVACTMAAKAILGELLVRDGGRVAGVTVELFVLTEECPVPVTDVVEGRRLPFLIPVTLATSRTEATGVGVLARVTADAIARQLVFQVARAVAILTVNACMHSLERIPRFLEVVELGGLPPGRRMAVGALRPPLAVMHIVGRMA